MLRPGISWFVRFSFLIVEPICIVESVKNEVDAISKKIQIVHEGDSRSSPEDDICLKRIEFYGAIVSVSPSGKYCLFLSRSDCGREGLAVVDCDSMVLLSEFTFSSDYPVFNVGNPFSFFSWDETTCSIL